MKRALVLGVVLGFVGAALAGIRLAPTATYHYDLSNCDGGVTATLPEGRYLLTVTDETTWLCVGDAGCAAGGQPLPASLVMEQSFGPVGSGASTPVSCRSVSMTGDIAFNLIAPGS